MIAFLFHTASLYGTRWNAHDIEKRYGIRRQLSAQICGGTADWVGQDFGNRMDNILMYRRAKQDILHRPDRLITGLDDQYILLFIDIRYGVEKEATLAVHGKLGLVRIDVSLEDICYLQPYCTPVCRYVL